VHSSPESRRLAMRTRIITLSLQTFATYLPVLWVGRFWGAMAGFLAGSVLLVLGPIRWVLFAAIGVSVLVPALVEGLSAVDVAYLVVSTMLTGLIVFAVSSLSSHVAELHATRAELARMAVTQERLRVARDLHDLLGYGLSAITLRSELIHRLLPDNPARAREETAELLEIARRALADVRIVARGYREMSLTREVDSARSVLAAAEIETSIEIPYRKISRDLDTVIATVLREGVTNLLRHSKAQRCVIKASVDEGRLRLRLSNDGVRAGNPRSDIRGGSGLGNLVTRLESVGGRLSTEITEDGWFHLAVEVPNTGLPQARDDCPSSGPLVR
jgi:two-component system, NarL family, sensor histidine kinase DesK